MEGLARARRHGWAAWAFAIFAFATALIIRLWIGDSIAGFPFTTFLAATIVTALVSGALPAACVAIVSVAAACYFFIPPIHSFAITEMRVLSASFYGFLCVVAIGAIAIMHLAMDQLREERARADALAKSRETMFHELQHRVANKLQFVGNLL
ncbi:MAG: DUF4118 domain-containing protein, partial [Hyphomonadaceae bacterium]